MTDPVAPAKFAHPDDVVARYVEGTFPADKAEWAQGRIEDVESILIGLVSSLAAPVDQIDPVRLRRVKALVVDKVLELYRNPKGRSSTTSGMDGFSATDQYRSSTTSQAIWFSKQELDSVRARKRKRRFGSVPVAPPWYARPC